MQNRSLFFIIIGIALAAAIGMILARAFMPTIGQSQVSIQVVVAPSLRPWVEQAALAFNQANRGTQVEIITANSLIPTADFRTSTPQTILPAAWLAEASFIVEMARNDGLQFGNAQSVASSTLAWGAYNDKFAQFNQGAAGISWETLNEKATQDRLKVVIAAPKNTAEGIASLISATAAHGATQSISGSDASAANQWLTDTLGDGNAVTPPTPAITFASVQGRTIGDLGILSMASWRGAKLDQRSDFTLSPVEPKVTLDYPFAIWTGSQLSAESQQAAAAFRDFLRSDSQQRALANFYFEPASSTNNGVQADGSAAQRLLDWSNRELR